jgi:hypothetical protein
MSMDFPAAHSMDTEWFAVDRDGHVASFFTGSDGIVPSGGGGEDEDEYDYAEEDEYTDWSEFRDGLFSYHYHGDEDISLIVPYTREEEPAEPLHVDQLPPDLREICQRVHFDSICFEEAEELQPAEFMPCSGWSAVGYLSSDGKVIRPLPGREKEYRDYYRQFRRQIESEWKGVRFEEIKEPEEPKRSQGKRRKKSDGD